MPTWALLLFGAVFSAALVMAGCSERYDPAEHPELPSIAATAGSSLSRLLLLDQGDISSSGKTLHLMVGFQHQMSLQVSLPAELLLGDPRGIEFEGKRRAQIEQSKLIKVQAEVLAKVLEITSEGEVVFEVQIQALEVDGGTPALLEGLSDPALSTRTYQVKQGSLPRVRLGKDGGAAPLFDYLQARSAQLAFILPERAVGGEARWESRLPSLPNMIEKNRSFAEQDALGEQGALVELQSPNGTALQSVVKLSRYEINRFDMLSFGSAPLRELRYKWKAGGEQQIDLEIQSSTQFAEQVPLVLPTKKLSIQYKVASEEKRGGVEFEAKVVKLDWSGEVLSEEVMESLKAEAEKLGEVRFKGSLDPRGRLLAPGKVTLPKGSSNASQNLLSSLLRAQATVGAPLPQQSVGVGARWVVRTPIVTKSLEMVRVVTYQLDRVEGDLLTLSFEGYQYAPSQQLQQKGPEKTFAMQLESFQGREKGTLTVDLGRVAPLTFATDNVLDMILIAAGTEQRIHTKSITHTKWSTSK